MSGSLTLALRTAQSGLLANQDALNAVSNNIANVNSPGYSRKVVNMEQRVVGGAGAGVQISSVVRKVDEGLLKSLRQEISALSALDAREPYFERFQELFGKPEDNSSLSHSITTFNSAVDALSVNPSSTLEQSEVVRKGQDVADKLQRMSSTLQELRLQIDNDISTATTRVSQILTSINTLNNRLISNQAISADVTDLRDQRDSALDELSSLIDIRYYYRSDGDVVVFTEGGRSLVDNVGLSVTHLSASAVNATTTHAEGDLNGIYVGTISEANDITNELRSGKLKGLVDMRDNTFPNIQSQLDEYAAKMRDTVNQVHNSGTTYPGMQTMSGTRTFIDGNQTMKLDGTSDVTFALLDNSGNQTGVTTLNTIMVDANLGTGAQASHGDWAITEVAATLQSWLKSQGITGATVALSNTTNGKLSINLNTTTAYLAIRDEANTAPGSTAQDASITLDTNGAAAGGTETFSGFSNMFGLNDFYVDDLNDNIHDTKILSKTFTLGTPSTLSFHNLVSGVGNTIGGATVALTAGMTLDQIITQINNTTDVGVTATKVPDGAGFRLRIAENQGRDMVITATNNFKETVGLEIASARTAQQIKVRDDIVSTPSNVARAALLWDGTRGASGEYIVSYADGSNISALADRLTQATQFNDAGGLASLNTTFTEYSISITSFSASITSINTADLGYQATLTNSLREKSDNFRGVNLDEEMTNLIAFEQAYGAAARIIASIQKMFDALENII